MTNPNFPQQQPEFNQSPFSSSAITLQEPQPVPPVWSYQGRFGRANFLAWNLLVGFLLIFLVIFLSFFIPISLHTLNSDSFLLGFFAINNFLTLIWFIPFFIFTIKRLHDLNHSGWLSLINLVPLVNFFFWFYLILAAGSLTTNQYGPKRETPTWESILAGIYLILLGLACFGLLFAFMQFGFLFF